MRATHGNRGGRASESLRLSLPCLPAQDRQRLRRPGTVRRRTGFCQWQGQRVHPSWRRWLARQVPLLPKLRAHDVPHRRRSAQRSSHTGRCLRRTNLSRANVPGVRGANAQVGRSPRNHRAHGVMLRALPSPSPRRSANGRPLDPVWQRTVHFRWLSLDFLASRRTQLARWAVP